MKNYITKKIQILLLFLIVFSFLTSPFFAHALTNKERCDQFKAQFEVKTKNPELQVNGKNINITDDLPSFCSVDNLAQKVIQLMLGLSGGATVIMIMLGGFWYLTSAGNEEQAEKGQKTLTYAVIGLVVIVMAFAIVRIVGSTLQSDVPDSGPARNTPASPSNPPTNPPPNNPNPSPLGAGDLVVYEDWLTPEIPATAVEGRPFTVAVEFTADSLEYFKNFCGVENPERTLLRVTLDGKNTDIVGYFVQRGSVFRAEATTQSLKPSKSTDRVAAMVLKICSNNKAVAGRNIVFQTPQPVAPR